MPWKRATEIGCGQRGRSLPWASRLFAGAGLSFASAAGCILADPPATLTAPVERRPTILHDQVQPPASRVLGVMPDRFIVPVEVSDPRAEFEYRLIFDYDQIKQNQGIADRGTSQPGSLDAGTIRYVVMSNRFLATTRLDECHVIEAIVATEFFGVQGPSVRTPSRGGSDSITWFYSPSGDPGACPRFDAGVNPPIADAGADGGADE